MSKQDTPCESDAAVSDLTDWWIDFKKRAEDANDPVEQANLAEELTETVAATEHHNDPNPAFVSSVIKESSTASKLSISVSQLREMRDDRIADFEASDDDGAVQAQTIYELVRFHLDEIVVYTPTDVSAEAKYHWIFDNGIEVETEREHFAPGSMAEAVFAASGSETPVSSDTPDDLGRWEDWIRGIIANADNRTDKITTGRRTLAVEDLQSRVSGMTATSDLGDAVQRHQLHLNTENETVEIPYDVIERVLREYETLNARDLQIEMDKRGIRLGTVRRTQMTSGVNVALWPVDQEWIGVDLDWSEVQEEEDRTAEEIGREVAQ